MKKGTLQITKRKLCVVAASLFMGFNALQAQVFIPATAYQNIYPAAAPTGKNPTCYSQANVSFGGPVYDAYISAMDGRLVWRMTTPSVPSAIFNQGFINYAGCVDLNVGITQDVGGTVYAVVAYYKTGTGHRYDLYKWTTLGLSLFSSTALSSSLTYKRISMDSHKMYGIAIVWENTGGIGVVTGNNAVFTAPLVLTGTSGYTKPDVAFSHSSALNLHFVYNKNTGAGSYAMIESMADFFLINAASVSYPPTNQDVNSVTSNTEPIASIDAPDHYSVENWAYAYTINGADVFTRSIDFNTTGVAVTTNIVNGSLGNHSIPVKEIRPRIAYNQSCNTFHVAWYTSHSVGGIGSCYFSEQIKENAGGIVSAYDYELISTSSAFPAGAGVSSVAFSKQNDNSPYLYCVFIDNAGLHHAFHKWTNLGSFRTAGSEITELIDNCSSSTAHATSIDKLSQASNALSFGPNPFTNKINLNVSEKFKDNTIQLILTDITGKVLLTYQGSISGASKALETASENLSQGAYFISASMEIAGVNQNFKVIKSSAKN